MKRVRSVESMSKDAQIKRLVRQRNALLRLIDLYWVDGSSCELSDDPPDIDDEIRYKSGRMTVSVDLHETLEYLSAKINLDRSERLHRAAEKAVGNLYLSENKNPATGDIDDPSREAALILYRTDEDPWLE